MIARRKCVVDDYHRLCALLAYAHGGVKLLACRFPYPQSLCRVVTIVVVGRRTPEVGLETKALVDVLTSIHAIGGDYAFGIQRKVKSLARHYRTVLV